VCCLSTLSFVVRGRMQRMTHATRGYSWCWLSCCVHVSAGTQPFTCKVVRNRWCPPLCDSSAEWEAGRHQVATLTLVTVLLRCLRPQKNALLAGVVAGRHCCTSGMGGPLFPVLACLAPCLSLIVLLTLRSVVPSGAFCLRGWPLLNP